MPLFDEKVLQELVKAINDHHLEISSSWVDSTELKVLNLKKNRIDHIVDEELRLIDVEFLKMIDDYHHFLNIQTIDIEYEFDFKDFDVRTRIKQKDSIVNKLIHYGKKTSKEGVGVIPINKCMNDIFGIRIIFENIDHNDASFTDNIKKLCEKYNLRKVIKTEDEYLATHLYFKNEKNIFFPWELQIWSKEDSIRNEASHKKHKIKRQYTKWPDMYKNDSNPERREI
ncbi:hypothetical protein [Marinilactibacillus kalidii]|uniref:hypothetical protein n=1 Tax=Marinilactibacillus kalidii TaxID=2820274 RepID=UPI001ABDA170|nr:hypothetical protein [Marinilactibacillus kalidii]